MGDRWGDANQSQLSQLRVSAAEEGHPHEQLSRDSQRQLIAGVGKVKNLHWLLYAPLLGDDAGESGELPAEIGSLGWAPLSSS